MRGWERVDEAKVRAGKHPSDETAFCHVNAKRVKRNFFILGHRRDLLHRNFLKSPSPLKKIFYHKIEINVWRFHFYDIREYI